MAAIPLLETATFWYLIVTGFVWIGRIQWARRYRVTHPPISRVQTPAVTPKVSVIVPAKDEELNIERCLNSLMNQTYPNYEIIVVDDRSVDRTGEILERIRTRSKVPFKIIRIEKLPPGWTGKNHGMFTASRAASGDWLLYTDADTTHQPESIASAVNCAVERGIDFLTLAPQTEVHSFWEKTVQPLAVGSLALWFDSQSVNDPRSGIVLANGQYILVKRRVYEEVGGNESVKSEVVEDVELAKRVRSAGFVMNFLNGTHLYATRMYSTLGQIKTGWTRIFTYLFNKNAWSVLHKIALFVFFSILPFVVLAIQKLFLFSGSAYFNPAIFIVASCVTMLIIVVRFIGNKLIHSDPWYALLHPVGSVIMVWILLICLGRIIFNRPSVWRGDLHR